MYRQFAKKNTLWQGILWGALFCMSLMQGVLADTANGILYQFSNGDGRIHYLLGTMHSSDKRVLKILDQVEQPLSDSSQLVMEMVPDVVAMIASASGMMLPADQDLKGVLGTSLYQKLLPVAKSKGLPEQMLLRMRPWAAAMTISLPEMDGEFLDQRVYRMALEKLKQVRGLETAAEQLAIFSELTEPQQVQMLEDALSQMPQMDEQYDAMAEAYLVRDLKKLSALAVQYEMSADQALIEWFQESLINKRNKLMHERLLPILEKGNAFVAVGALHLVGETGLIASLQRQGYTVTPIY